MSQGVLTAQVDYLTLEAQIGGYEAAAQRADQIEKVYASCANLIGAKPHQVAQVENATAAWNQAFHSLRLSEGDQIITSEADYGANFIAYLQAARFNGVETVIVPSDDTGAVDVNALENLIDERTKLISITHAPTNGGLVNPAEEIGEVARSAAIPYLLDACQTVGQLPLDVERIGCDFLSATGRKYLRGPRGTGFLYASDEILERVEPAFLDHHGANWTAVDAYEVRPDARRFENWEFNYGALVGLGVAADEALAIGLDRIEQRVNDLAEGLRSRLRALDLEVYDLGQRRCGLVTTSVPGVEAVEVKRRLAEDHINISTSSPASTLIDASRRGLPTLLRLSVHYYNTEAELDRVADRLAAHYDLS